MAGHELSFQTIGLQRNLSSPSGGHEPMVMGSPSSPSAASHSHSQFLPGFLLGDHTPVPGQVTSAANASMWSTSGGWGTPQAKTCLQSPFVSHSQRSAVDRKDVLLMRGKDKGAVPPVRGLLDTSGSYSAVDQNAIENIHQSALQPTGSYSFISTPQKNTTSVSHIIHSTPAVGSSQSASRIIQPNGPLPASPAQVDPFYTQGETLSPYDVLDETWVTVFGFPPSATSYILTQFSQYGTVVKHVIANEGNWMHLHYQSKMQAKKALSKSGKIIGNNIMVGVTPCIDKTVMGIKEEQNTSFKSTTVTLGADSFCDTPTQGGTKKPTSIRPLTAAYKAASVDTEVIPNADLPRKKEGILTKAMEYIFGW